MCKQRILKVQEVGDRWKKQTKPQILLSGKWISEAGIPFNTHISVENPQPGTLVIRLLDDTD